VIVTVAPDMVQLPVAAKPTVKPDEAVALTLNGGSLVVLSGSGLNVMVWLAFAIDRLLVPLLVASLASPAKLALTPAGYVPAVIADKLTLESVAIPDASVGAVPTAFPLRLKPMDLPLTPVPPEVNVADSVVVPPYVPDAVATARDVVAPALGTSTKF
jgi:hypothetical protein